MNELLVIDDLSVSFRRYSSGLRREILPCLSEISLLIGQGEIVALIGESGAGKSLVAQSILGLLPGNAARRGRLSFAGAELDAQRQAALRGRRISLVPQSIGALDPMARVEAQLRWAHARAEAPGPFDAAAALSHVGLAADLARRYPHELSGGMARRVLIAMAMTGRPDLIVADEPTNGLDPENTEGLLALLETARRLGSSVLLISHDLEAALRIAGRVAIMRGGRIEGVESAAAFSGQGEALKSAYARALWMALPGRGFGLDVEAA